MQASLTLNLAKADSNFCLQITFQWLHKSAASSSPAPLPTSLSPSLLFPLSLLLHPLFIFPVQLSPPPPLPPVPVHHHFTISLSITPSLLSLIFSFPHTPPLWRWLRKWETGRQRWGGYVCGVVKQWHTHKSKQIHTHWEGKCAHTYTHRCACTQ